MQRENGAGESRGGCLDRLCPMAKWVAATPAWECGVPRANDVGVLLQVNAGRLGDRWANTNEDNELTATEIGLWGSTRAASHLAEMTETNFADRRRGFVNRLLFVGLAVLLSAPQLSAQVQPPRPQSAGPESRAQLEARAAELEREAGSGDERERARKAAEAQALRTRLRDGDFHAGDRIVVKVDSGVLARADTFVVREGPLVEFPGLPAVPLAGVLHVELSDYLAQQLGRFFRDPQVQAYPLLRIAIFGPVGSPGYYTMPADILLSDAIMNAGGPGSNAKMDETVVKRGDREVIDERQVQRALVYGYTLSQLNLRDGDAVHIGGGNPKNWTQVLRAVSIGLGLAVTVYGISQRF